MTVQTEISRSGPYAGAGTTGPFTVGFRFLDNTHLQVIKTSTSGIDSTLALTTDYSVSGAGGASGTVTLVSALASGERLTIIRDVPFTQLADYVDNDAFPAESHEDALDLLTMQTQQNREALDRSLTLPATVSGVSTELPAPESNKFIGWNETGTALQNLDTGTLATIVAYGTSAGDLFSGNGSQTAFTLSANPGALYNLDVSIGGVDQRAGLDYTWSSGTTITFTIAPVAGTDNIQVKYKQALPQGYTDGNSSSYLPAGTGAVPTTVQTKLRESVSVKDFGAVGNGVADDTTAIALAIASNPKVLVFPPGTYLTTGFVIPANSNIGEVVGVGRPTLKRQGQGVVASGLNLSIIAIYKNKVKVSGFIVDGQGQSFAVPAPSSTIPPDRTWYADIAVLDAVGSADVTLSTDNFVLITDCYFKDAPGSSIAGSQMQATIVQGNKFDGWNDHAVYASGSATQSMDIIVEANIFKRNGYTGGFAVKARNRVKRFIVSNNTFELSSDGAIAIDQGNAPGSHYKPANVVISGNVGSCGIFFTANCNFTVENPTEVSSVVITGNNVSSGTDLFYIGEDVSSAWAAHLLISGNTFRNSSGTWKVLLALRYIDTAYANSIVLDGNTLHDYAIATISSNWPQMFRVTNNVLNLSLSGANIYAVAADDATAKEVLIADNEFIYPSDTNAGALQFFVSEASTLRILRNRFVKMGSCCIMFEYPKLVEVSDNVFEDSRGLYQYRQTTAARASVGSLVMARNKNISTVGASAVPFLFYESSETSLSNIPLLNSYNIFLSDNYFKDVTGGIFFGGTAVNSYVPGQKIYAERNYGTGTTFTGAYGSGGAAEQNTLPSITI